VRLASLRLAQGCSASLASPDGLVMTNHHCVHACVEQLSTPRRELIANGFSAKTLADETRCPNLAVNQLVQITDVTARVMKAAEGLAGAASNEAKKGEMSKIEKECARSAELRCDVVTLYSVSYVSTTAESPPRSATISSGPTTVPRKATSPS